MKIYTRGGDSGETGLPGGRRVPKDDPLTEAVGALDELNAVIGAARSGPLPADLDEILDRVQHHLFRLGAELSAAPPRQPSLPVIGREHVAALERAIDGFQTELPELQEFVLPGGTGEASLLQFARAVCRRAERRVVTLARREPAVSDPPIAYLNRLGDLLFVLARLANRRSGRDDVRWDRSRE